MFDFVSLSTTDVASAINPASAHAFLTIPAGSTQKAICVDNAFNVDMCVMVDQSKPIYVRAGQWKIYDLTADNTAITSPSKDQVLSIFAVAGVAPSSGNTVIDGLFGS